MGKSANLKCSFEKKLIISNNIFKRNGDKLILSALAVGLHFLAGVNDYAFI